MSTHSLLTPAQHDANAKVVYDFWIGKGFTPAQAAGFVANADAEVSLDPTLIGDHGQAVGIAQWHPDRAAAIIKGCGIDVAKQTDLPSQLAAMWWELQHPEHHALALIQRTTTAYDAGATICRAFERSGLGAQPDIRGKKAQTWDNYFRALAMKK
jgi:Phage tail lysozyme